MFLGSTKQMAKYTPPLSNPGFQNGKREIKAELGKCEEGRVKVDLNGTGSL